MNWIAILAVILTACISLYVGISLRRGTQRTKDLIPTARNGMARVDNATEFKASTVATTISLATVVLAYFELAGYMGAWLYWTVATTAAGLLVVLLVAQRVRDRLESYGNHLPTLHEFLGTEFQSPSLAKVGALATSLGFLGAFGVELSVGSRLFTSLVPQVPKLAVVVGMVAVGVTYTALGGFRAVILTDRIQMRAIWALILALGIYYASVLFRGFEGQQDIHPMSYNLAWRPGLTSFLIGIFILNVPTYIADMGMWQRLASMRDRQGFGRGLRGSIGSASASWALLATLAILAPFIVTPDSAQNPLSTLLISLQSKSIGALVVLFVATAGLFAAMLSTASTQLIVVTHTLHEDLLQSSRNRDLEEYTSSPARIRWLLVGVGLAAVSVVEVLTWAGFSIADLVFAVFGAQLALVPPLFAALYLRRHQLGKLKLAASIAIFAGFLAGWIAAGLGKALDNPNLVFLAPVFSLAVSAISISIRLFQVHFGKAKYD